MGRGRGVVCRGIVSILFARFLLLFTEGEGCAFCDGVARDYETGDFADGRLLGRTKGFAEEVFHQEIKGHGVALVAADAESADDGDFAARGMLFIGIGFPFLAGGV